MIRTLPTFTSAEAKFQFPFHRDGLILRSGLVGRLAAVPDDVPLVLLTAAAGYGKTTALSQWAAEDVRDFAWLTVDRADSDPARLAEHIVLALHRIEPLDVSVFRALAAADSSPLLALPQLLSSLQRWPRPVVLVLDDLHELHGVAAVSFIRALIAGLPPGFHVAVGSRRWLDVGRLRSENRCAEFGPDDLALTAREAAAVLAGAGVDHSAGTVEAVGRRTEGWAAGVYMAALAMRTMPDAERTASRLTGDDPYLVDYLRDELLGREAPEAVRFMLRTAALDEMSGSLCDHVLASSGSARRLTEAARRSLFVVPLDRDGEWYRYHHLVGEMLRSELQRREPGEDLRVHRRAAGWYERHYQPEKAIAHALAGQDQRQAAQLLDRHARTLVAGGRMLTVRDWLDGLDEDALAGYPPLGITAGWIFALHGDPQRAQRFLHAAERGSYPGPLPDGSASLASATRVLRAALGSLGVDRMLADAASAAELEPPGTPWHPMATAVLGIAHALTGAREQAVEELNRAARLGWDGHRPEAVTALAEISLLAADAADAADWSTAARKAAEALKLMAAAGSQDHVFSILGFAAAARVAAHRAEEKVARRHVGQAIRLCASRSPGAFPWLSVQVSLALGQIFLDLGDYTAARFRAEEARRDLARLLTEGVLNDQLRGLSAALSREGGHRRVRSAMALTTAEMRVLQLLPTHLSLGEIGDELHTSRSTVKTHVAAVYRTLHCSTRAEAVRRGRDLGLIEA
jgi:LuxR family maltose regulon positive regulatory protein